MAAYHLTKPSLVDNSKTARERQVARDLKRKLAWNFRDGVRAQLDPMHVNFVRRAVPPRAEQRATLKRLLKRAKQATGHARLVLLCEIRDTLRAYRVLNHFHALSAQGRWRRNFWDVMHPPIWEEPSVAYPVLGDLVTNFKAVG